jgi:hypothetical protein
VVEISVSKQRIKEVPKVQSCQSNKNRQCVTTCLVLEPAHNSVPSFSACTNKRGFWKSGNSLPVKTVFFIGVNYFSLLAGEIMSNLGFAFATA